MSLADLIRGNRESGLSASATATAATAATNEADTGLSVATVATVAVANPPERKTASRWLLHFADADALEVTCAPERDQAEVLAGYPNAIAAEPLRETTATVPADAFALFDACVKAGLYDDADRAALPAMFALDAEGARRLIEAMHDPIASCERCAHFRRPGRSDGYCTGRDDLPIVYGFLRALPDDEGMRCPRFARK